MNERIKELAVKSGFPEWSNDTIGFELEQFAELIIDQCCKACETATTEDQPLHLVSLGYSQRIKEHFGVK
jgi:hypothetical protein